MIDPTLHAQALPYTDTKPLGHADFYFAVNATFRFIINHFGYEKLQEYWRDIGTRYYKPVSEQWKLRRSRRRGGLLARILCSGARREVVDVMQSADEVRLEVKHMPGRSSICAITGARSCLLLPALLFVSEAMAAPAGMTVRITGREWLLRAAIHVRSRATSRRKISRTSSEAA